MICNVFKNILENSDCGLSNIWGEMVQIGLVLQKGCSCVTFTVAKMEVLLK